jgi:hypothetical protein
MCICAAPTTPLEGVTIYGGRESRDFRQVKSFFDDRGVLYTHADIQDQANLAQMKNLSGQQEAVVVEIGKKIFVGFVPDELEAVLP